MEWDLHAIPFPTALRLLIDLISRANGKKQNPTPPCDLPPARRRRFVA